jgi:hypothetical protein
VVKLRQVKRTDLNIAQTETDLDNIETGEREKQKKERHCLTVIDPIEN